jgi:hypothetical protein
MLWSVESVPQVAEAGAPIILRMNARGCTRWLPGWSAVVTEPVDGVITINVSANVQNLPCFGTELQRFDIAHVAPVAGSYTIRVIGGGTASGFGLSPLPYAFIPVTSRAPLTVTGGSPPVAAVPVPVMVPWALGLLAGTVMLGGTLMLRRRRRSD